MCGRAHHHRITDKKDKIQRAQPPEISHRNSIYSDIMFSGAKNTLITGGTFNAQILGNAIGTRRTKER